MNRDLEDYYNAHFYNDPSGGVQESAQAVLGLLFDHYAPASVVDVGCGRGAWLAVAKELGSTELTGIEGDWVKQEDMLCDKVKLITANLEHAMPELPQRYDLCMSLEVAEHLPERLANPFVDLLCRASNVVLFSAAVKMQRGTNHINEQRQSYWMRLFEKRGYTAIDMIRPNVWENESVKWWYRQNAFLYVKEADVSANINLEGLRSMERTINDIVHPFSYEQKIALIDDPTWRFCMKCIWRRVCKSMGAR